MSGQSFGRYTLLEKLGHGGMSVVHKAFDPRLERDVAIKILHPHLAERADSRARFSREARAVARLRHPHIVEVFDYASPQSEDSFIVTEYVDGPTLRDLAEQTPLRHPEIAILLMVPIIDALDRAHSAGIVHRDVKPENIMVRSDGSPVLLDFGIAQMIDMPTLTATGTMLGSPAHMAPEVIDGKDVGEPADIFSVGTTLYWLVCGSLPFSGPNPSALFRRILESKFDPVLTRRPRAGRRLAQVIERCLATEPSERPTSTELRQALTGILTSVGITDIKGEQRQFNQDPGRYQDELHQRLIPALCTLAQENIENERISTALDCLDRVLELAPGHTVALNLISKIEKARRTQERVRLAAILACGLGPLLIACWFYFGGTPDGKDVQPRVQPSATSRFVASTTASDLVPETASRTMVSKITDGGETLGAKRSLAMDQGTQPEAGTGASDADAPPVDSASGDAGILIDAELVPDATAPTNIKPKLTAKRTARRLRPRRRPTPSARRSSDAEPTLPNAPPTQVRVRVGSDMKNARVYVNGSDTAQFLFQIEVANGLVLEEGRNTITFKHPACENETKVVRIRKGQKNAKDLLYTCKPLPGRLRITAPPPGLEIRRDNGQLLGRTNQEISVPMPDIETRIALTIGTPGGRYCRRVVKLNAGQPAKPIRLTEADLKTQR